MYLAFFQQYAVFIVITLIALLVLILLMNLLSAKARNQQLQQKFDTLFNEQKLFIQSVQGSQSEQQSLHFSQLQQQLGQQQLNLFNKMIGQLNQTTLANRQELSQNLAQATEQMSQRLEALTKQTQQQLMQISDRVDQRLTDGFEKTTQTFNDIVKRLALIDDAQKKITELSTNVVSLQQILNDKRSRGAFGEVQLNALIRNVLPEKHFALQHKLSNGKIADCILFMPKPTGNVVIDAKFPLESFQQFTNEQLSRVEQAQYRRQFKQDVKKHIKDISEKYLIEHETADGAIMFIPAEAIFAELHAHHSDIIELAYQHKVWLASPTTLMAILTTVRSVIKDDATREQVHIIQQHLAKLSADFSRFKTRFNNLAKHIDQAATDVQQINTSAQKISQRFTEIEQVELTQSSEAFTVAVNTKEPLSMAEES